ncbi:unnamed protein product [Durusdinium trenchii]|uniref:Uncharacterized protein n=2 Tax=Durusdinium trenchii TaxID=1381693 RepID=A0ABP0L1F1_9DINO
MAVQGVCTDLEGLAALWDGCTQVRARIREFRQMCLEKPAADDEKPSAGDVGRTVANLKFNSCVIEPLAKIMVEKGASQLIPCIMALLAEVKKVHEDNGSFMSKKDLKDQAWTVRYLFGVLKRLTYKDAPPAES